MEALAAGVPVAASDLPVLRELFAGAAALTGASAELVAALVAHRRPPDSTRQVAGRALAGRYTREAAAGAHLALCEALAARRG
jgi:hypothetical protein